MRAVNLIPADERRGGGGSDTGLAPYLVLGVLALVVAFSAAYALASRSISDRRDELANVQAQAKVVANEAAALQAYSSFSALSTRRTETVRSLAASRFDWSHALHEVARTLPSSAWLTGMRATVTPTTKVDGGVTDPLRASLPVPAIELVGCTTSQKKVAGVISSLRRVDGVQRVSISSSEKLQATASGPANGAGATATQAGGDCRNGDRRFPKFSMTLFFAAPSVAATGGQSTAKEKTP
jgi:Tfp pilus assembly protein PilN